MGTKYEVTYYDWHRREEITWIRTNSLIRALRSLWALEREWECVSIIFRRNRTRKNPEYNPIHIWKEMKC